MKYLFFIFTIFLIGCKTVERNCDGAYEHGKHHATIMIQNNLGNKIWKIDQDIKKIQDFVIVNSGFKKEDEAWLKKNYLPLKEKLDKGDVSIPLYAELYHVYKVLQTRHMNKK